MRHSKGMKDWQRLSVLSTGFSFSSEKIILDSFDHSEWELVCSWCAPKLRSLFFMRRMINPAYGHLGLALKKVCRRKPWQTCACRHIISCGRWDWGIWCRFTTEMCSKLERCISGSTGKGVGVTKMIWNSRQASVKLFDFLQHPRQVQNRRWPPPCINARLLFIFLGKVFDYQFFEFYDRYCSASVVIYLAQYISHVF